MSRARIKRAMATASAERARTEQEPTTGMVFVPAGAFLMGSNRHYPEEGPVHRVAVDGFFMDQHLVTNAAFRRFVEATGHVTFAEIAPKPADYPGALPEMLVPSSLVFVQPKTRVDMRNIGNWWVFMRGADWRHPYGPESNIDGKDNHPVVHVAYSDAEAYARWAGKELPTEAEWEFAARGGLNGTEFAWGDEVTPDGHYMANYWQGEFPFENLASDGYERTSPVGAFPPNAFGLYDMIAQRLGVDLRLVSGAPPGGEAEGVLRAAQPARRQKAGQLRPGPAPDQDPAQGPEGGLPSLRQELLLPLPAPGALPAPGRHLDLPYRLPLHCPRKEERVMISVPRSLRAKFTAFLLAGRKNAFSYDD